jgi:hypothetical protein
VSSGADFDRHTDQGISGGTAQGGALRGERVSRYFQAFELKVAAALNLNCCTAGLHAVLADVIGWSIERERAAAEPRNSLAILTRTAPDAWIWLDLAGRA